MATGINRQHAKPPLGGHHFPVSATILLKGKDADDLLAQIVRYRAENALPFGDPEAELLAHYQRVAPHLITNEAPAIAPVSLMVRRAQSVMHFFRQHPPMLSAGEVELIKARRKVCAECPFFVDTQDASERTSTDPYFLAARRRAISLTVDAQPLARGWCVAHHQWVALLTMTIRAEELERPKEALSEKPQACWIPES